MLRLGACVLSLMLLGDGCQRAQDGGAEAFAPSLWMVSPDYYTYRRDAHRREPRSEHRQAQTAAPPILIGPVRLPSPEAPPELSATVPHPSPAAVRPPVDPDALIGRGYERAESVLGTPDAREHPAADRVTLVYNGPGCQARLHYWSSPKDWRYHLLSLERRECLRRRNG